jgi:hypothetical protein
MEIIAIISHLLRYVLAVTGIILCVILFRRRRQCGWLLIGAIFLEALVPLVGRVLHGSPLLFYKTQTVGSDGVAQINYRFDFPICYILAVIGLYLIFREIQDGKSG